MATSTTVGPITLTTPGEQTGYWLNVFASDVQKTNNTLTWAGVNMPDGTATVPFTWAVPANAATAASTPGGNTSTINNGTDIAIEKASSSVYVKYYTQAVANAADNATLQMTLQPYSNHVLVDSWGNNDSIVASGAGDTIAAGGTGNYVYAAGSGDTVVIDSDFTGSIQQHYYASDARITGGSSTIVIGSDGDTQVIPPAAAGAAPTAGIDLEGGNSVRLQDPRARDVLTMHGPGNTVSALTGVDTIFAVAGADSIDASQGNAQLYFVGEFAAIGTQGYGPEPSSGGYLGNIAVSTLSGGTGNSTVFAKGGVLYNVGTGDDIYVGGSLADLEANNPGRPIQHFTSTIIGGTSGHASMFGGTVGDLYNVGGGSDLFVNGSGSDTITGGTVAPTLFGNSGGSDRLVNTGGGVLVADGSNDTIDALGAQQGNSFFASNAASVGNTTLIGSNAAPSASLFDEFVVSNSGGTDAPHTLTIGFQAGDALFLSGYSSADNQAFAAAVAAQAGSASFAVTLSDQTTIQFVGRHPTATFNGGTVAL